MGEFTPGAKSTEKLRFKTSMTPSILPPSLPTGGPICPKSRNLTGFARPWMFFSFPCVHFSKQAPEGKENSTISSQSSAMWKPLTLYLSLGKGLVRKSNLKLASLKGPRAGCAVRNSGGAPSCQSPPCCIFIRLFEGRGQGAVVSSEGVPFPTTQWLCVGFIN